MGTLTRLLTVAGLLGLLAFAYSPIRHAGFVYEDARWMASCDHASSQWQAAPRSLMRWTWCWQAAYTPSPQAFHAVNLMLHGLVSGLLGVLIWSVTASERAAWMASSLFLLHPLQMESVAYLSGRGDVLAGLAVVGACLAALHRAWWVVAACLLLGVLVKEFALVALGLVPLVLLTQLRLTQRNIYAIASFRDRSVLRGCAALTVVTLAGLYWLELQHWSMALSWVGLQSTAVIRLMALTLIPLGQTIDYDYALVPTVARVVAVALFVTLAMAAWRVRRTTPLVACGLGWIVIATWPRFLVQTPASVFNEHQFYVPLMGFTFLVAALDRQAA